MGVGGVYVHVRRITRVRPVRPGPTPTTRRGRKAGGRELRAWASAAEYAEARAAADACGETMDAFVRAAVMGRARVVIEPTKIPLSPDLMIALAEDPSTPPAVLDALASQGDAFVRAAARSALRRAVVS